MLTSFQVSEAKSPDWVDLISSLGTSAGNMHESCPQLDVIVLVSPKMRVLKDPPCLDDQFPFGMKASRKASLFIDSVDDYRLLGTSPTPRFTSHSKPLKRKELLTFLDFLISSQSQPDFPQGIIIGLDPLAISTRDSDPFSGDPYFSHLSHSQTSALKSKEPQPEASPHSRSFAEASDLQEATHIVTRELILKVCTYIAVETDMLDLDTKLEDLGVDSLVVFRLRSWIFLAFQAPLEPSEITSADGIRMLASRIVRRSTTLNDRHGEGSRKRGIDEETPGLTPSTKAILPKQPLPDLGDSLKLFLDMARIFCSEQEYSRTTVAVERFEDSGIGSRLHERLLERFRNPETENWLAELYPVRRYLCQRSSLLGHQSYFGTHPLPQTTVHASSRAATITLAVHKFKKALDTGELPEQHLYGKAVDTDSCQWLFNAYREPGLHQDRLVKYASNDDIVILSNGMGFRLPLVENGVSISHSKLASTLSAISDSKDTQGGLNVSALTMDERDEWARVRLKYHICTLKHR